MRLFLLVILKSASFIRKMLNNKSPVIASFDFEILKFLILIDIVNANGYNSINISFDTQRRV